MRYLMPLLVSLSAFGQIPGKLSWLHNAYRVPGRSAVAAWDLTVPGKNQLLYSEQADNAAWTVTLATVTADVGPAPDGTNTADRLEITAAASYLQQVFTFRATRFTFSVWLKRNVGADQPARLRINDGTTITYASVTATSAWQRYQVSAITLAAAGDVQIRSVDDLTAADILVWGMQLNEGAVSGPYKQTTDSQFIPNLVAGGATLQRGATANAEASDPVLTRAGLYFNDAAGTYTVANALAATFSGDDKPLSGTIALRTLDHDLAQAPWNVGNSANNDPFFHFQISVTWNTHRRDGAAVAAHITGSVAGDNNWHTHTTNFTGTTFSSWQDRSTLDIPVGSALDVGVMTVNRFSIGAHCRIGCSQYFRGTIAYASFYTRMLSISEIWLSHLALKHQLAAIGVVLP
jgi:hypothetical protein